MMPMHSDGFIPPAWPSALIGAWSFAGIRFRQERELLREEARPIPRAGTGATWTFAEEPEAPRQGFMAILRTDALFRHYMISQFLGGVSNMMLAPVVILVAIHRTEGFAAAYLLSIGLAQALPALLSMVTLPLWSILLDKQHVATFRCHQSGIWVLSFILMGLGAAWTQSTLGGLAVFALGRAALGVAQGGGGLAWQIGHHDFAPKAQASAYMGVHVMLTGMRGAFAPFFGVALYEGWSAHRIGGTTLPGFDGMGAGVFAVATLIGMGAWLGYAGVARRVRLSDAPR